MTLFCSLRPLWLIAKKLQSAPRRGSAGDACVIWCDWYILTVAVRPLECAQREPHLPLSAAGSICITTVRNICMNTRADITHVCTHMHIPLHHTHILGCKCTYCLCCWCCASSWYIIWPSMCIGMCGGVAWAKIHIANVFYFIAERTDKPVQTFLFHWQERDHTLETVHIPFHIYATLSEEYRPPWCMTKCGSESERKTWF